MNKIVKYWLPVYLIAFIIFYFSSLSNVPEPFLVKTPDYLKHFVEYFVLSIFVFRAFKHTAIFSEKHLLWTFIFITLFGISDEIFQAFVPGRESSVFDVMYDSISSLILIGVSKLRL